MAPAEGATRLTGPFTAPEDIPRRWTVIASTPTRRGVDEQFGLTAQPKGKRVGTSQGLSLTERRKKLLYFDRIRYLEAARSMPLTAADKQRQWREKLKEEGTYDEYKERNKEQVRRGRERQKEKLSLLPKALQAKKMKERREAGKSRVAKCRARKKMNLDNGNSTTPLHRGYRSLPALRKAVERAQRGLPSTPHRKKAILRKLYSSHFTEDELPAP